MLDDLVTRVHSLLERARGGERVLLGVAGAPGGGKSTFVEQLLPALVASRPERPPGWVAHLPMDGFHLADAQLERLGRRGRKGAPDTFDVDGYASVLERVRADRSRPVYVPGFERDLEQPIAAALVVEPSARIVVTEGNYLLHDDHGWARVAPLLDECWYVDLADDERRERLVRRHVQFGKSPVEAAAWVESVDEPNALVIRKTRSRADLLIDA